MNPKATFMKPNSIGPVEAYEAYHSMNNVNIPNGVTQAINVIRSFVQKINQAAQEVFNKIKDFVNVTALRPFVILVNQTGTDIEKIFNILNSMPIFALIGGPVRYIAGQLQVVAGAAMASIGELGYLIGSQTGAPPDLMHKWQTLSKLGLEHIIHGCLNTLRASGETLVASYTMGLANVLLFVPNLSNNRNFVPYFSYGTLVDPLAQRPAFTAGSSQSVPIAVVVDSSKDYPDFPDLH